MAEPNKKKPMSSRERAKDIARMTAEGMSSRVIARALGISHVRVCQVADRHSIILSRRGTRRFGLFIAETRADLIIRLAQDAGVSPSTMIERATRIVFGDGESAARKHLGKLAVAVEPRKRGQA